jgi:hypothetical protein
VNGRFAGWERAILHSVGKYLKNDWRITLKQAQHAQRLFAAAREDGFDPGAPEQQQGSALDRGEQALSASANREVTWETIDDVPQSKVKRAILSMVPTTGEPVTRELLLQGAMRKLGFQRLKKRIRARLNRSIGGLVRTGKLGTDWDRVWLEELAPSGSGKPEAGIQPGERETDMDPVPPPALDADEPEGFEPDR